MNYFPKEQIEKANTPQYSMYHSLSTLFRRPCFDCSGKYIKIINVQPMFNLNVP